MCLTVQPTYTPWWKIIPQANKFLLRALAVQPEKTLSVREVGKDLPLFFFFFVFQELIKYSHQGMMKQFRQRTSKTEAVIKLWTSLNPHLLQQVGKCNLLWETSCTKKAPRKKMKLLHQSLKSILLHLIYQARIFWLTQERVHSSPRLPLTALQQKVWTRYREVQDVLPPPPVQRRAVQSLSSGNKRNLIFESTLCALTVSPLIYLTA